ncbi:MAG TPA: SDR family oxidoreductase [Solirubrobacteraceae bacterium]|nr:SDR family oxidoreductase [Solirubrobacteraceae bacterium]
MLRPGLLRGVSIVLAGAGKPAGLGGRPSLGEAISELCTTLGARVLECDVDVDGDDDQAGASVQRLLADSVGVELLVVDGAALFARAGEGGDVRQALRACLAASWQITRAVAEHAFLASGRGGRIVYVTPSAGAQRSAVVEHADAARAGLENLARTLSIEWARRQITAVTIAPAPTTRAGEVAALLAYLASPAGAYFSGCLLDLRGAQPDMPPNRPPVT